ncbi:alpha/beta hydrolase [Yinghuangia seranimata]|uniref:alpha/beta hydrolase n=1 Tax=Yinghuangia seranimata TaxID=408067 RepID=UPI00248B450E|nr:alpha/beta hydrolase [Yinghuangia seranimata]MDI2127063.1 alpha/beta hydrolase [Yinghuangia seranimata]
MADDESILAKPTPEPDAELRYGPEAEHVADVWLPAEDTAGTPLVLLVHGGFWRPAYDRVHTRHMAAALRDAGWPVAALEYRRVPGAPEATTDDVRLALREIPEQLAPGGPDSATPVPTVLMGHSAGGHLVLWAAAVSPPDHLLGTVALAPVADLVAADAAGLGGGAVKAFLGTAPDARPDLDPLRLDAPATPVTLVHGVEDATVPVAQSRTYATAHPAAHLVAVPDSGHYDVIDPSSEAWRHVVEAVAGFGH